jgi:hypothetical protein
VKGVKLMNKDCMVKHTAYQPTEDKWLCPKCGAGGTTPESEGMVISSSADDATGDCVLLHPDDEVECMACGYAWSGRSLASALKKRDNVITCPTCSGKGTVQKP